MSTHFSDFKTGTAKGPKNFGAHVSILDYLKAIQNRQNIREIVGSRECLELIFWVVTRLKCRKIASK